MRKALLIATALIAVLALSVGALAYPLVVGAHPLSTAHTAAPAAVNHPKSGDDNSTGNQTNDNETGDNETAPAPPAPEANETENESEMDMGNVSVQHNVTVTEMDNTTWVNGTISVVQNGTTLAEFTFQIVSYHDGVVNVTLNDTQMAGSTMVTLHGLAFYSSEHQALEAFGVATASQNGTVLWQKAFDFEVPASSCGSG